MSDLRAVEIALGGRPIYCAWCDAEYRPADLGGSGLVLWVDTPTGSMRVCSEGCAIEVRSAIAGGRTDVYTGCAGRSRDAE